MWKPGDKIRHRFNAAAGPGRITSIEGRSMTVEFPAIGSAMRFAAASDALEPYEMAPGTIARLEPSGETVRIERIEGRSYRLSDGRLVADADLWPLTTTDAPVERLARGEVDSLESFANRMDALHLRSLREAGGLGSFLGGRIKIFPHQLYVAERAVHSDPVRWLLADEVGLGKTVEACLVLNHLARTGRADRILVITPSTLAVQWLGELYRKFHQVFVHLDEARRKDVERELGSGFNPFEAHASVIVPLEDLIADSGLARAAVEASWDLVIVDEAHRLERRPHHPGSPAYRAAAPIVARSRHALLLTATPLESDAHGFFRLLQLLRPEEFPEETDFEERLARGAPLPPCTSATRRADIGGLPPRVPRVVDPEPATEPGWEALLSLAARARRIEAGTAPERRRKVEIYRRALASPAAYLARLPNTDTVGRAEAEDAGRRDPRALWLASRAPEWRRAGEKTLVFVADLETLESLKAQIERTTGQRIGIFHEGLTPARADIEVAQFRLAAGPGILISTECGGEGRNFEFCKRLVLFDLPWNPGVVEQRIGRLDRIDRARDVEIVYFRAPRGLGLQVARLYEEIGVFREPLTGLEGSYAGVEEAIASAAAGDMSEDELLRAFETILSEARAVRSRIQDAAWHELHRDPYRPSLADSILGRLPDDLEESNAALVLAACEEFGFHVVPQRGRVTYGIEFGSAAAIDHLPGAPAGSSFLGTFEREEAVEKESLDFFASGHPLVEGILQELLEGPRGQVGMLQVSSKDASGSGVLAIVVDHGVGAPIVLDDLGRERPEWAALLLTRPLKSQRVRPKDWTSDPGWGDRIRALFEKIEGRGELYAVAAFRIVRS